MNDNNTAEYLKSFLHPKGGDKNEHKQLFINSLAERILSKILFEYNNRNTSYSFELEDILLVLRDSRSSNEADFLNEVFRSCFSINVSSLSFYEKYYILLIC